MADCEAVQEESAGRYKTFDASSSGRSSGRFQAAAGVACVALALVALLAVSSDAPARTELTVEHTSERMSPDANMLDRLLSREEAADKQQLAVANEQQLATAKPVAAKTAALASAPANLQASHSPLSFPAAAATQAPTLSTLSSPPAAAVKPVHTAAGPSTPLHTAAARVAAKQQGLAIAAPGQSHTQPMGDDGWKDTMVKNNAAAQVSLPGYAYFMGQKAEKNLLKSSLATTKHESEHVVHEDAAFRMDGGMFNDKKTANTPDKQVPLYQNFF